MFQSKTHGVFPHIFGRQVCDRDRSPPKRRSLALPDPTDPVSLWLLQKPPWLWLAPVARQRGCWKDIEHGTKQLKQHHFQYFIFQNACIIPYLYNIIYIYIYVYNLLYNYIIYNDYKCILLISYCS